MRSAYDGTPTQAGLCPQSTQMTGHLPHFSSIGLRLMVVVERLPKDAPGNRSRSYTEYTCRDLQTGEFATGCRTLASAGGVDDGDEVPLTPATKLREGSRASRFNKSTAARETDGTVVAVQFVEGSHARGIIMGAVQHQATTLGSTTVDGERRLTRHKGTSIEIQRDGTYIVSHAVAGYADASFIRLAPDGSIALRHASGTSVLLNRDSVQVEGASVQLGAAALDQVVRGTKANDDVAKPMAQASSDLSLAVAAALTAILPDVVTGTPSSATVGALQSLLVALQSFTLASVSAFTAFETALSTKVTTE